MACLVASCCCATAQALVDEPPAFESWPIRLDTPAGVLQGTLTVPLAPPPWPVALLHAGSGPTDRDGNQPAAGLRTDALKELASGLAARNIASVRYDKRGVGASPPADEAGLRIDAFGADAAGWIALLRADSRFSEVAYVGHSEGALIGALAIKTAPVDALVWVSAPAARASDLIREQLAGRLPADLAAANDRILDALGHGQRVDDVPAALAALYRPLVQGYLMSWFRLDPARELADAAAPVLLVQGTSDLQVALNNADRLKAARPDARVVMIPGVNHLLKRTGDAVALQQRSAVDSTMPLAPGLVDAIADFIVGR